LLDSDNFVFGKGFWRATGKPEIDRLQPRGPEVGFWEFSEFHRV